MASGTASRLWGIPVPDVGDVLWGPGLADRGPLLERMACKCNYSPCSACSRILEDSTNAFLQRAADSTTAHIKLLQDTS